MTEFDSPFLQSVVAPICRYTVADNTIKGEQLHGIGFLVASDGVFLTARHVLSKAALDIEKNGGFLGIFPIQIVDGKQKSLHISIARFETAADPYDIAIFGTSYRANTFLHLGNPEIEVWQDCATMGYPASVVNKTPNEFQLQQRGHKGHIQRVIPAGRLQPGNHPSCFELSFSITDGLSGSPLFIQRSNRSLVIGVCIGSHESRVVKYQDVTVKDGSQEIRESVARLEEFGIAHDLRSLLDWSPDCLDGKCLGEISK